MTILVSRRHFQCHHIEPIKREGCPGAPHAGTRDKTCNGSSLPRLPKDPTKGSRTVILVLERADHCARARPWGVTGFHDRAHTTRQPHNLLVSLLSIIPFMFFISSHVLRSSTVLSFSTRQRSSSVPLSFSRALPSSCPECETRVPARRRTYPERVRRSQSAGPGATFVGNSGSQGHGA